MDKKNKSKMIWTVLIVLTLGALGVYFWKVYSKNHPKFGKLLKNCVMKHCSPSDFNDMVDKDGNITKKKNYKGLCYPVVVVCAYLFMKSNVTFKEVIQYLYSKKPEELSTLFLKMNNHLVNTVIDDGYW